METNNSLFSLSVDPVSKLHLTDAAKWARFLAIVGFVFLALMIAGGIFTIVALNDLERSTRNGLGYGGTGITAVLGGFAAFGYLLFALISFFPLFYLLRFGNAMRAALLADDQERLNTSFQNLKACLRYLGIITIIGLVLFGFSLFFSLIALMR